MFEPLFWPKEGEGPKRGRIDIRKEKEEKPEPQPAGEGGGCSYCGGSGHSDVNCPKIKWAEKSENPWKCSNCGEIGHTEESCNKKELGFEEVE
jgi:hypothetical protein